MSRYYDVQDNIENLPDVISYYEKLLSEAKVDCAITGNLEKAAAEMPPKVEKWFNHLQEIEAILEHLNIQLRKLKSRKFRKYLENYNKSLSSRDCDKFVDGEDDIVDFENIVNGFAFLRNKFIGVVKGLENKSFSLNNIIRLRCAGLDDASL